MDGILAINPSEHARLQQNKPVRSKALVGASARKPLGRIENTSQKSVKFDKAALKLKHTQSTTLRSNTPAHRRINKQSTSKKITSTPAFQIFADKTEPEDGDIEYMPRGDPEEKELPLPDYVEKLCSRTLTFNTLLSTSTGLDEEELQQYEQKMKEEAEKTVALIFNETIVQDSDDLSGVLDSLVNAPLAPSEEWFEELENDESFSLEVLDREIREAGLTIPPEWSS